MKKVALISDGWKRLITYAWVDGVLNAIHDSEEDICLYQYNCYGNWSKDKRHNEGEYNIYNLPDLSEFDGILLDCNNIEDKEQLQKVICMIREADVPVVSITYVIDGFYYAGIDNREPIVQLMDHLYQEHGCRTFIFAGGPKGNYENSKRIEAFQESLEKYGIDIEQDMFLYGDYDYDAGVSYITKLVAEQKVPDAIVCANDNIAAGICAQAEQLGLRVPDDFLVTGFDNLDKAAYFRPQITTVAHNRGKIAYKAMEVLFDIWAGKEVKTFNFVPTQCILAESCGCPNNHLVDYREYVRDQLIYGIKKQLDDELLVELEGQMAECEDFKNLFQAISEYFADLECDGFYIVVDKKLFDADISTVFPQKGYDLENMVVAYATEHHKYMEFHDVKELYWYLDANGANNVYMYTPIHFRDQAVGFTIMKNGSFLYDNPYFYDIHSAFVKALEDLFKRLQLESSHAKMKELYNRDVMTGLYNRVAYNEMIKPHFKKCCDQDIPCALAFFDVDYFKEINDTKGHEYGDICLKKIAKILQERCPEGGYAYRYGGDEFAVFFPYATPENSQKFSDDVKQDLIKENISISTGVVLTDPSDIKTLDEYLVLADQKMYEAKAARKRKRARR